MAGTDLARDKKEPSQFLLCCFSSMAKTSNSIRPLLLGRLIEMGPKSCSRASLVPYLLMALIADWGGNGVRITAV